MPRFRSLLIDRASIRVPGMSVSRLELHRHLDEHRTVAPHRHRWCQALLYLSGSGEQRLADERVVVTPGTLVVIPAGSPHAFVRSARATPTCLMINFRWREAAGKTSAWSRLSGRQLARVRENLAGLLRLQRTSAHDLHIQGAAIVLDLLTSSLAAVGWVGGATTIPTPRRHQAVGPLLSGISPQESLAEIIRRSGYHRDHLNRLIKAETGMSLGQHRARLRIRKAQELLASGLRVSEVATRIGLPDQGYFSRWFRKQTGLTPTQWAMAHPGRRFRV